MNIFHDGKLVGEIALAGGPERKCPYPGKHGYLLYGFFLLAKRKPVAVVCDTHCHNENGYWQGLLEKVKP